jgi:hypothetical protein
LGTVDLVQETFVPEQLGTNNLNQYQSDLFRNILGTVDLVQEIFVPEQLGIDN